MDTWQRIFLFIFAAVGLISSYLGYRKSRFENKNLVLVPGFFVYGAFVWSDIVVFGFFWAMFSIVSILLNDWILFLLGYSVFWVIRSLGETMFWFNQQFSTIKRYTHVDFFFSKYFGHHEYTVWFVMQILMQCITVVSVIFSIYFTKVWLAERF